MQKFTCDSFAGERFNIMMSALFTAAGGDDNERVYEFLNLPKTSLIVELVDALYSLGYEIKKV